MANVANITPEEAQRAAKSAGDTIERVAKLDQNKDGRITIDEILTGMLSVYGAVTTELQSWRKAVQALRFPEVRDAIVAGFKDGFDIDDDVTEHAIEQTIDFMDSGFDTFDAWKAVADRQAA